MKKMRMIATILFVIGFVCWSVGAGRYLFIGSPANISTDPNDPLVKAGRVRYMMKQDFQQYRNTQKLLGFTAAGCFVAGSIVVGVSRSISKN